MCVPSDESLQEWLNDIPVHRGTGMECPLRTEREILAAVYAAMGGTGWNNNDNWLTDEPLGSWHGVEVDDQGRVIELNLEENNLAGMIPPELGLLRTLQVLGLNGNALAGLIPSELGRLTRLRSLRLSDNDLRGGIPPQLGSLTSLEELSLARNALAGGIPAGLDGLARLAHLHLGGNDLTGPIPAELGVLARLETIRLGDNNLRGLVPPLGELAKLTELELSDNHLAGSVPPELGSLANLEELRLGNNMLGGSIPAEFGKLARLRILHLHENRLNGRIPSELAGLAGLVELQLHSNAFTGFVPAGLGNLADLRVLRLGNNYLAGGIPPELGSLANLTRLGLGGNGDITGPIPPELGSLAELEELSLSTNRLTGRVPPELGNLTRLASLFLHRNAGLSGVLPSTLTDLRELKEFQAWATDVCAPDDTDFQDWLLGVPTRRVSICTGGAVYLTQAVQSRKHPVPLVAGEEALLRVFVTAKRYTTAGIPPVRARFFVDDTETYVVDIPGQSTPIPAEIDESSLLKSANATIPDSVLQPGLEVVIDVDPDETLHPSLGVQRRIPVSGRLGLDVRDMPTFDLTLIPFLWNDAPDSAIVDTVAAMASDPDDHDLLHDTRTLLPVGEFDVRAHAPVVTSSNAASDLLLETSAIQAMEGGAGHYAGMMSGPVTGGRWGMAAFARRAVYTRTHSRRMAHVLAHGIGILHAQCGQVYGIDPRFPRDGSIGAWGYDFRDGGRLVDPSTKDLLTQCSPWWIGEFPFTRMVELLREEEAEAQAMAAARPARSLLLWGGAGQDGKPFLEPAMVVDARPRLPTSDGLYRLAGTNADGETLFAFGLDLPEAAGGDGGGALFAFVLPVHSGWDNSLAVITLSGPGGTATLAEDTKRPAALLLDSRTGQVRAILRDLPESVRTRTDVAALLPGGTDLELLFSRGIPGPEEWER